VHGKVKQLLKVALLQALTVLAVAQMSGCGRRVPLEQAMRVVEGRYAYMPQEDGTVLVWAKNDIELRQAILQMKCPCSIKPSGGVYVVRPVQER